jgi:CheY-like chemotaxis protein
MPSILVVDDDLDNCCNMADILTDLGYDVDTVDGGAAALRHAERQPYDVGLLDLRMPGMDGLTLCRHLRHLHPRMVTLIVSGYADAALNEAASAAGARRVVPKPVHVPSLLAAVAQAVTRPNS